MRPFGETAPGCVLAGWSGPVAPAKIPDEIVDKVNTGRAVLRPFAERATLPEFLASIVKDMVIWAEVVKATGRKKPGYPGRWR